MTMDVDRMKNFEDLQGSFSVAYGDTEKPPRKTFHIHNAYEIMLVLSEEVAIDVNEESYSVPGGTLLLFNTMDLHRIRFYGNGSYRRYVLWFKYDFLQELEQLREELLKCFYVRGFERANFLPLTQIQLEKILELFHRLENEKLRRNDGGEDVLLKLILGELLVAVNELYFERHSVLNLPAGGECKAVYQAIQYIQGHISQKLEQETLARLTYMEKRQLCNSFRKITGLTTGQYILNCRITAAKAFLVQGMSVSQVCEKTGFGDYSNFSRTFRKHVGISPKQYAVRQRRFSWHE